MDDLLREVIAETPSLGGILIVVWFFLKHLTKKDEEMRNVSKRVTEAFSANADVIRENSAVIGACNETLKDAKDVIRNARKVG